MTDNYYMDFVLSGKFEVNKFLETDNFLCYFHTNPFWEFHLVLIPKFHIIDIYEIENDKIKLEFFETLANVVRKIKKEKKGCQVEFNVGEYQHSKHLHVHIHSGKRIRE